jgi:hypothetical protein
MLRTLESLAWQEMVDAEPEGEQAKRMGSSFFRGGDCNFNPYGHDHTLEDFAQRFLLKGWLPEAPLIKPVTRVTAFGSCFATHISEHLVKLGFDVAKQREKAIYVSSMGEGLVNVHSIVQQFRWALEGWAPPANLWHGYNAEECGLSEDIRQKTREVFLDTEVFILTFGLSEIWYDEVTGGVFWRAVPMKQYDAARHKFRVCTFEETKACIAEVLSLISRHVPDAKVVMTVSPIPLIATFRPVSCMTANSVSKALIRGAIDETLRELGPGQRESVYYFPAFEIVNECFPNRFVDDGRHLHPMIVPAVMNLFEATFCETQLGVERAEQMLREARLKNAATIREHPLFSRASTGP